MTSRHLYSWLALVATSLALVTSSAHDLMAHTPLGAFALSADVAAGHGGAHGPEICGACFAPGRKDIGEFFRPSGRIVRLVENQFFNAGPALERFDASQTRSALSTQAKIAIAPRLNARLLAPARVATFSVRLSHTPASPRAPPLALST